VINELSAPASIQVDGYDTMYRRLADGLIVLLAIKGGLSPLKHCESIDIETTPAGAIFRGSRWPEEIDVDRNLLDYLPGPHVVSPHGHPAFPGAQRLCRLSEIRDRPGGWNYRLMENQLMAEAPVSAPEPALAKADQKYFAKRTLRQFTRSNGCPTPVPPVALPEWFMRADFEHNGKGELTIRSQARS